MSDEPKFGATGKFPRGKLNADDEGELRYGIAHDHGKILVKFGKPVELLGFDPQSARALANALLRKAYEAERYTKRGK